MFTKVVLALILTGTMVAAAAAAGTNEMIPVKLTNEEQVETIPFELGRASLVRIRTFFPPASLGAVKLTIADAAGKAVDLSKTPILKRGKYTLSISAAGTADEAFPVKIEAREPLDRFEPNDTRDTAASVTLPLRAIIELHDAGRPDWLRIHIDQPGILSIHTRPLAAGVVPHYMVTDAKEAVLYKTVEPWDHFGARYVRGEPGDYYLKFWKQGSRPAFVEVELALYIPSSGAGVTGGLVAVGMKDDSPDMQQFALIAEAAGQPIVKALSPESLERELALTLAAPPVELEPSSGGSLVLLVVLCAAVVIAAVLVVRWRRRSAGRSQASA